MGGGIPILRPLRTSFSQEFITDIQGILNGTTNYILTKMERDNLDFATALKQAQDNGFAERNPEADIEGYDPCRKIAILASLVTGGNVKFSQVPCEGISKLDRKDLSYARAIGRAVKLLGVCEHSMETDEVYVRTAPYLVAKGHPLYAVSDVFNGILVRGNMVGDLMFYGSGAGKLPTASAVVSDVVECAKNLGRTINIGLTNQDAKLADPGAKKEQFFVRAGREAKDAAASIFGSVTPVFLADAADEFAFVKPVLSDAEFDAKKEEIPGYQKAIRLLG